MSKKKTKRRNKKYTGVNSKLDNPTPLRVRAVKRSKAGQWWYDNKKKVKISLGIIVVLTIIIWSIASLFFI